MDCSIHVQTLLAQAVHSPPRSDDLTLMAAATTHAVAESVEVAQRP